MLVADKSRLVRDWLQLFPFVDSQKLFFKEFSDGVKVAEIIKLYHPEAVRMHFFIPSLKPLQKRVNWENLRSSHQLMQRRSSRRSASRRRTTSWTDCSTATKQVSSMTCSSDS